MATQNPGGNLGGPPNIPVADEPGSASRKASTAGAVNTHGHNTIYLDTSVTFEAYHFWAERAREEEKHFETVGATTQIKEVFSRAEKKKKQQQQAIDAAPTNAVEKSTSSPNADNESDSRFGVTTSEWEHANRAARTATWVSIFYLIATDILGPYSVPWSLAQMGLGPGITLYVVFAGFAAYSGFQLWWQFTGLDSPKYPLRNYGDLGFRVYGNWARQLINVLQSCQFFLNVTLLIVSKGQGLAQMARGANRQGFLCFVVAQLIFMLLGFLLGQIRTLQRLGFLANVAVWLNIFVIIMSMVVIPVYGPNEEAAAAQSGVAIGEAIRVASYWPEGSGVTDRINGLMNAVYAYGGATLFVELMAEMRRPMDFYKGFICAQVFIFVVYITMGIVVYSFQGQYTFNPVYQGIPNAAYAWQTVGNAVVLISGLIAALLYGNIGIKVFYAAVLRDVFRFPPLETRTGKITWIFMVPIYWACAFVIAAAVPQISQLGAFVGAAFILQFSYTFPPILQVGYNVQRDAILPEEVFDPATGQSRRVDGGLRRILRGFSKQLFRNTFDSLYFICALATAGLGMYAAIIGMTEGFSKGTVRSFSCQSPTGS